MKQSRETSGFSLIELLVVVTVCQGLALMVGTTGLQLSIAETLML